MKARVLAAALTVGGLLSTSSSAAAQGRPYRTAAGYQAWSSGVRYAPVPYRYTFPAVPRQQFVTAGYGYQTVGFAPAPYQSGNPYVPHGFAPPVSDPAGFIRSLYVQVLNREPDPNGLNIWLNILAQSGGDTNAVTTQFVQAAQAEINMRNALARPSFYPYPGE